MTADDHDFLRPLTSAPFADNVRGGRVGFEMRFHLQPQHDPLAAVGHPLQAIRVFAGDPGRRNLRRRRRIVHLAGVRQPQAGRPDGADQRRDGVMRGGARSAVRADHARCHVVGVRHVEHDDPAAGAARVRVELLEAPDHERFRLDALRRGADAVAEPEHRDRQM